MKAPDFRETGRVIFSTYRKPNCKPQYLSYHSKHPHACKEAIYSGEATRHLINCTREEDYYLNMNHLKDALITRGYPIHMLKDVPYDEAKRASLLKRLAERRRSRDQLHSPIRKDGVVAFKVEYSPLLYKMGLGKELQKLLCSLRREVGQGFLQNTRLVIANKIRGSAYIKSYAQNFLLSSRRRRVGMRGSREGGR